MTESIQGLHDRTVGDIAAKLPGATAVFHHFGIEFCCQGHVSLANAVSHRCIDMADVEKALHALDPMAPPDAPQETGKLIDHIQTRYHDTHRHQIAKLIELSQKVESVHVNHPQVPAGLSETLQNFLGELEALMQKQETIHFPALLEKTPDQLSNLIRTMRHDHNEYAYFLDQVARLTDDITLPEDACASWQALYADLVRFRADLIEHIHLENNVLFPRFEPTHSN